MEPRGEINNSESQCGEQIDLMQTSSRLYIKIELKITRSCIVSTIFHN